MKQFLPYNMLLVAAVAVTGLMVFYNFTMRDTFAVRVAYQLPAAPAPEQPTVFTAPQEELDDTDDEDDWDVYSAGEDEPQLTSVSFPLDLNRATEAELRFIPQVGDVMAQRIVQYRDVLGGYTDLEQLRDIKGVGDATYANISAYLYIKEEQPAQEGSPDD